MLLRVGTLHPPPALVFLQATIVDDEVCSMEAYAASHADLDHRQQLVHGAEGMPIEAKEAYLSLLMPLYKAYVLARKEAREGGLCVRGDCEGGWSGW